MLRFLFLWLRIIRWGTRNWFCMRSLPQRVKYCFNPSSGAKWCKLYRKGTTSKMVIHFLKAHCLIAKLKGISGILSRFSAFLFNLKRFPKSFTPFQRNFAFLNAVKFKCVAFAGNAEFTRGNAHPFCDKQKLKQRGRVRAFKPISDFFNGFHSALRNHQRRKMKTSFLWKIFVNCVRRFSAVYNAENLIFIWKKFGKFIVRKNGLNILSVSDSLLQFSFKCSILLPKKTQQEMSGIFNFIAI